MSIYDLYYKLYFEDDKPRENAGFLLRLMASIVDMVIIIIILYIVMVLLNAPLLSTLLIILYFPILEGNPFYQGTFGKRMFRIKVVDSYGRPISYQQSTFRFLSKLLSLAIFGIGFFMILFTQDKQSLHDRLTRTTVKIRYY